MTRPPKFSDVDHSGRSAALVEYLARAAQLASERRRIGYDQLHLQAGSSVLDVGCGAGEVCVELVARVGRRGRVAGVDVSQAMIDAARRAVAEAGVGVELHAATAYALPFPDGTFDAVRAERVFQHLEDADAGLAEMLRVTRSGGRITVMDPDHGQLGLALEDPADRRIFEAVHSDLLRSVVNPHSGTRLRGMFVRSGLRDIEQTVSAIEFVKPDFVRMLFLDDHLAAVVENGEITREDADRFARALEARHQAGTFFANVVAYRVAATKP